MTSFLRRLFPVRREERGLVLLLYALLTLMVLADWIGKVGTNAVFVKRVGVTYLPVMYIVTPVVMLIASSFIFGLVDRMRRRDLFFWYIAATTVLSVATQAAMELGGPDYWWAYIFAHVVKETVYLIFWVYAGNLFDSEQSKRIFPLFAGALLIGKIGGGIASTALQPAIHSENFMAAQAVGFALCFALVFLFRGHFPEGEGDISDRVAKERPQGLRAQILGSLDGYRAVASDRLLRPFGVNIFFWYFLMQIANYLYAAGLDAQTTAPTMQGAEDAYALLYASVYTSGSILALLIQTFFTGSLIRRLGVSAVLFCFPLWYVVTYGLGTAFGLTLLIALALQAGERIVVPAIHTPATQVVYSLVAAELRPRARAFFSGGVNAIGNIGAAFVLLAGAISNNTPQVLAFGTACSLLYLVNTWNVRRALGQRIVENLTSPEPELRRNAEQMLHGEGRAVPTDRLAIALSQASADVEAGIRLALTRRGALGAATEANAE